MTKLTASRLLADRGVIAVSKIFNEAGATAEVISNDFGEDLVIQSQLRDEADHFTILIQVKSKHLKRKVNGRFSVSVDVAHLYRWASHMQSVLICLFDDESGNVYARDPKFLFSLWSLLATNKRSLSVEFGEGDLLDTAAARRRIWNSRIRYYETMIGWYEMAIEAMAAVKNSKRRIKHFASERNLVVFRFLQSLGAIEGDTISGVMRTYVTNASINFQTDNSRKRMKLTRADALALSLVAFAQDMTGGGLPALLINLGAHVLEGAYMQFHPDEWRVIADRLLSSSN